jgi:hypothetical protein
LQKAAMSGNISLLRRDFWRHRQYAQPAPSSAGFAISAFSVAHLRAGRKAPVARIGLAKFGAICEGMVATPSSSSLGLCADMHSPDSSRGFAILGSFSHSAGRIAGREARARIMAAPA